MCVAIAALACGCARWPTRDLPLTSVPSEALRISRELSPAEIEAAVRAVGSVRLGKTEAEARGWLRQDGAALQVDGFVNDAWAIEGLPKAVCLGVVRPEDVAGVLVFHVVPVIVDDRTLVTVQGRQASFASLLGKDRVLGREISATFVVTEGGLCMARAVAFSGKEAEWTSSVDVPPSFSCDPGVLLERRASASFREHGWLDVPGDGEGRGTLVGSVTSVSSRSGGPDPAPGIGELDVAVADALGPAPLVHVARVFIDDPALLERAQDLLPEREDETATLSVRKQGRFVLLDGVD